MVTPQTLIQDYFSNYEEALLIANCESGFYPRAYNADDPYGGSYGIFQINGAHGHLPEVLYDMEENIRIAKDLYDRQGWYPWFNCATKNNLI